MKAAVIGHGACLRGMADSSIRTLTPFSKVAPGDRNGIAQRRDELIELPLVSDGIIFRILQDLLYLDGERISYRALDVEQIGSVYEAMMGFTVETAHGISIGLGSDHLVIDLEYLLTKNARRPRQMAERKCRLRSHRQSH